MGGGQQGASAGSSSRLGRTGLGYAGVIFSFFLWSTLLGPLLGMLLAIPLSAFCVVLWRALKSKYIRPVV